MRHFLNGIAIAPRNLTEIGVVSDFTGNPDFNSMTIDSVILPREANEIITTHIQNVGLFEGIPYSVEVSGVTLEYYVDLMEGVQVREHEVEVQLKKRKSKDNFFERAEGTSFELLSKNGVIFTSHDVPYFVIKDNQFEASLQLSVITYLMAKETYEAGERVQKAINLLIEASTPIPGLGVGVPPVVVYSYNVPAIIGASLNVIATLIYFALMLIATINMATQLFLIAFPPKRKLKGTYFTELMNKACEHFGYSFQSDLLNSQPYWAIVSVPLTRERKSIFAILPEDAFPVFNKSYPTSSDTTPSVLTFIKALEIMFNAKTFIMGGVVRIERRDWLQNQTQNQLFPAMNIQSERDNAFTYNVDDVWKRYYLHYKVDFQDLHTADGDTYDFHDTEKSTEPIFPITNPDLVTIKGLNEVSVPFSLGARKDKLNWLELSAKETLQYIDALTGIFGNGTNFAGQIDSRKDAMKISQVYFSETKVIYGEVGAVKSGQIVQNELETLNIVQASALYDNYHYINEIANNDYIIKENVRIRISAQDFVSLQENNFAEIDGVICEILRIEWIDEKSFAQISYKQPLDWANGKVETISIN